jgi:hypothetical protein
MHCISQRVNCTFKSTKKLAGNILDLLNESTVPGYCIFPLSNPHSVPVLDIVPDENIGKASKRLWNRLGNLKFVNFYQS